MKIGTPENPEIIEPGQQPRAGQTHTRPQPNRMGGALVRWRTVTTVLSWMVTLSLPALFMDGIVYWLFDLIREGSLFAWLLIALALPPAIVLTLLSLIVVGALFFVLIAAIFGRNVQIHQTRMGRFVGSNFDRFTPN